MREAFQLRHLWILGTIGVLLLLGNAYAQTVLSDRAPFWDLNVYTRARDEFHSGLNPYISTDHYKFVYPPLTLWIFSALGAYLEAVLLVLYLAALAPFLLPRFRPFVVSALVASVVFPFATNPIALSVVTGNITFFLHLGIIALWFIQGARATAWGFFTVVFVAALFKPYFLGYYLVPILVHGATRKRLLYSGLAIGLIFAIWAMQAVLWDTRFADFLASLNLQVFKGNDSAYRGDIGYGYYRYFAVLTESKTISLGLHIIASALILSLFWIMRDKIAARFAAHKFEVLSLCAIALCILINPRLKVYDYAISNTLIIAMLILYLCATFRSRLLIAGLIGIVLASNLFSGLGLLLDDRSLANTGRTLMIHGPSIGLLAMACHFWFRSEQQIDSAHA